MRFHVIIVLAAALTLAACGGSEAGSSGTTATTSDSDRDAARVRLQECMAEHGVEIGNGAAASADQRKLDEAMEACKEYRQDAFGDLDDEERQELQDSVDKLTQCLRDQGIDVPDIKVGSGAAGQLDRSDPDVQEALEVCNDEVPDPGSSR